MKTLKKKVNSLMWKAGMKASDLQQKAISALKKEDGDTNFLSIIIILAIVLVVAVVFIALKDEIMDLVEEAWKNFKEVFNSSDKTLGGG